MQHQIRQPWELSLGALMLASPRFKSGSELYAAFLHGSPREPGFDRFRSELKEYALAFVGDLRKLDDRVRDAVGQVETPHDHNGEGDERNDEYAVAQSDIFDDAGGVSHVHNPEKNDRNRGDKEHTHHQLIKNGVDTSVINLLPGKLQESLKSIQTRQAQEKNNPKNKM